MVASHPIASSGFIAPLWAISPVTAAVSVSPASQLQAATLSWPSSVTKPSGGRDDRLRDPARDAPFGGLAASGPGQTGRPASPPRGRRRPGDHGLCERIQRRRVRVRDAGRRSGRCCTRLPTAVHVLAFQTPRDGPYPGHVHRGGELSEIGEGRVGQQTLACCSGCLADPGSQWVGTPAVRNLLPGERETVRWAGRLPATERAYQPVSAWTSACWFAGTREQRLSEIERSTAWPAWHGARHARRGSSACRTVSTRWRLRTVARTGSASGSAARNVEVLLHVEDVVPVVDGLGTGE